MNEATEFPMGFESFQVRWNPSRSTANEIDSHLRSLAEITNDVDALRVGDSRYYLWNDGRHVVEIEWSDSSASLSARFMLCNPESITDAYAEFLLQLQRRFGGGLAICDARPADRSREFGPGESNEFRDTLRESIAARRAEWVRDFGPRTLAANSRDVYREIILPKCEPVFANRDLHSLTTDPDS